MSAPRTGRARQSGTGPTPRNMPRALRCKASRTTICCRTQRGCRAEASHPARVLRACSTGRTPLVGTSTRALYRCGQATHRTSQCLPCVVACRRRLVQALPWRAPAARSSSASLPVVPCTSARARARSASITDCSKLPMPLAAAASTCHLEDIREAQEPTPVRLLRPAASCSAPPR